MAGVGHCFVDDYFFQFRRVRIAHIFLWGNPSVPIVYILFIFFFFVVFCVFFFCISVSIFFFCFCLLLLFSFFFVLTLPFQSFIFYLFFSVALSLVYLSIAFLIGSITRNRWETLISGIAIWFLTIIIWPLLMISVLSQL